MKPTSHWAANPAPPSAVGVTMIGSSSRSSAIVIFHGWRSRISSVSQVMNDQPSGSAVSGVGTPSTARMKTVESNRRPSHRNSSSQVIALSRSIVRTSPRP